MSVAEAAMLLRVSDRQVKRLKQKYDPAYAGWVHHDNQGREPVNVIGEEVRKRVIGFAKGKYAGFNDSHLQEKLSSGEQMALSWPGSSQALPTRCDAPQKVWLKKPVHRIWLNAEVSLAHDAAVKAFGDVPAKISGTTYLPLDRLS